MLNLPSTVREVTGRIQTDVKNLLSRANPWLRDSFVRSMIISWGNQAFDIYHQIRRGVDQSFPQTATGEYLDLWADAKNITPLEAVEASGTAVFTGTPGTLVPSGTILAFGGQEYETTEDENIGVFVLSVVSLSVLFGTTAECETAVPHQFAVGLSVAISGADQGIWNDTYEITSIAEKTFRFEVTSSHPTPATGTIVASVNGMQPTQVQCTSPGEDGNQDQDAVLVLQSSIAGIDNEATVNFGGITGGYNDETEEAFRLRVLDRWRNPLTPFNPANIEVVSKAVRGVTRVWVQRVTPAVGQVTVYFTRDNDEPSNIPDADQVQVVRDEIIKICPADMYFEEDLLTPELDPVPIDITLTSVVPDSAQMRVAIEEQLKTFFRWKNGVEEDVSVDALRATISQTFNIDGGVALESFDLLAPVSDVPIGTGQIATLGTVSYS